MKTKLFILASIIGINLGFSQESKVITWNKKISYNFKQNGEPISAKEVEEQLKDYPEALFSFESARRNRTFSQIAGGLGIAGIAYSIYMVAPDNKNTKWGIVIGSAALVGFSIPLYISADRQMCGALEYHNDQVRGESYYHKPKGEFNLVMNANGLGVKYSF